LRFAKFSIDENSGYFRENGKSFIVTAYFTNVQKINVLERQL
jgi:hypothetical protein